MNSFFSWIGGKNLLKKEIVKRFPEDKFDYFIEAFGGAAWVLFHKERHGETEVYNDLNGDLVNLFRVVKYHCEELQRELKYVLNAREIFEGFKNQNPAYMTDIQRAARFFWIIKTSFGSKGGNFGCVKKDINNMITYLSAIQERLKNVVIENKDFEELISSFKHKSAFLFLDPPYYNTEKYYSARFEKADHEKLHKCLVEWPNKFILTYNDCNFIRDLYQGYNIQTVERFNNLSAQSKSNSRYSELIIMNY